MLKTIRKADRQKAFAAAAMVLCPAVTFYLFDLYTHNPFTSMDFKTQLLNIAFYELTGVLFFGVFRTLRLALMLQSVLFMVVGLANYYVMNFRSVPIMPWDVLSLATAASVADNYSYSLGRETVLVLAGFIALLLVESRIHMKAPRRVGVRLALILLPVILLHGYAGMIQSDSFVRDFGLYDKLFTPTVMNKRDGNVVAFVMEMEYLDVEVPEGYSAQEAAELYRNGASDAYLQALREPERVERPNIIVIMDEAFSDLSVLAPVPSNKDYMPFLHSLQESGEADTGLLNVSVLGGNTANTEFEFLTGHTMSFLPQGSVPYQQYVQEEQVTLASYLKELGYETVAMHPYNASGWERDQVYPLFGFDTFLSKKNFPASARQIRQYISDSACFGRIIDLYEKKDAGEPLFLFNVTMQNHSGYDDLYENFTPDVTVEGSDSVALSQYLSLLRQTDLALEELIGYFAEVEEDTVIVFFGDHQPTTYVSNPVLRANGLSTGNLTEEETLLKYKVPFVIWSNFETPEGNGNVAAPEENGTVAASEGNGVVETPGGAVRETPGLRETSANYLAIDVLERCGLPLPPYQNFLKGIREEYPVVSGMQTTDRNGRIAIDSQMTEEEQEACGEALLPYRSLQYYLMFDRKGEAEKE